METSVIISLMAVLVSLLSYIFSRRSWQETYRPIVTAKIETQASGNIATLFNIVICNVGNRPATDIKLRTDPRILEKSFEEEASESMKKEIRACFSEDATISLLQPGNSVSNGFGITGREENSLKYGSRIPITIEYKDLNRRRLKSKQTLIFRDTTFFAGSGWGNK